MNKEELIKLINSLNIEDISGFTINYFSEEKTYGKYKDDRILKTLSYGYDIRQALSSLRNDIDNFYNNIRRDTIGIIEEKVNERLREVIK